MLQIIITKKFFLIGIIATLLISCGGGGSSAKLGATVTISKECIGAINEDCYEQMTKYCNRRDETGLELMAAEGQIRIISAGETGVVTEQALGKTKIRLNDNTELWCANEFIK